MVSSVVSLTCTFVTFMVNGEWSIVNMLVYFFIHHSTLPVHDYTFTRPFRIAYIAKPTRDNVSSFSNRLLRSVSTVLGLICISSAISLYDLSVQHHLRNSFSFSLSSISFALVVSPLLIRCTSLALTISLRKNPFSETSLKADLKTSGLLSFNI